MSRRCASTVSVPLLLALATASCSREATVTLKDGNTVQGEIYGSGGGAVFLAQGDGKDIAVERALIDDIRHPGVAAMITGGVLLGLGVLGMVGTADAVGTDCSDNMLPDLCEAREGAFMLSVASTGTGVGLVGSGFHGHMKSRTLAAPPAPHKVDPPYHTAGSAPRGLVLEGRF